MILFILFPFVGFYLGVKYQEAVNPNIDVSVLPDLNVHQVEGNLTLNTINLSAVSDSTPQSEYFRAQIQVPSDYYATDDQMLDAYDSQGGMAPPRIILMKGYQILPNENYYTKVTDNPTNECIAIWSTLGFGSIDDWNQSITQFAGKLTDQVAIQVGQRQADMFLMTKASGNVYIAYLPIKGPGGLSYYFNTCNTKNKTDFINVIKSIKFRGDLSLNQ